MGECYSPKPRKEYTMDFGKKKPKSLKAYCLGLGDADCVASDELWNLLSVTSKLLYRWEDSRIKMGKRPAMFPQVDHANRDLDKKLKGVEIRKLIQTNSVDEFCDIMINSNLTHLDLCKFFRGESQLKMIVKARQATCKQYRGKPLTRRESAIITMVKNQI
jgi:hypothetical protein